MLYLIIYADLRLADVMLFGDVEVLYYQFKWWKNFEAHYTFIMIHLIDTRLGDEKSQQ